MKQEIELPSIKAVILAAGDGSPADAIQSGNLKCLQHVDGVAILERMIRGNLDCGVTEFVFVLGFQDDRVSDFVRKTFPNLNAEFVHYTSPMRTSAGYSLSLAEPYCRDCDFIKFHADIVIETAIISRLLDAKQQNCLCIDRHIQLDRDEVKIVSGARNLVFKANKSVRPETAIGEFIGIEKISKAAAKFLFADLSSTMSGLTRHQEFSASAHERLIAKGVEFHTVDVTGLKWINISTRKNLVSANGSFA